MKEGGKKTIDHLIELFHGLLYFNMATTAHPYVWRVTAGVCPSDSGGGKAEEGYAVWDHRLEMESFWSGGYLIEMR